MSTICAAPVFQQGGPTFLRRTHYSQSTGRFAEVVETTLPTNIVGALCDLDNLVNARGGYLEIEGEDKGGRSKLKVNVYIKADEKVDLAALTESAKELFDRGLSDRGRIKYVSKRTMNGLSGIQYLLEFDYSLDMTRVLEFLSERLLHFRSAKVEKPGPSPEEIMRPYVEAWEKAEAARVKLLAQQQTLQAVGQVQKPISPSASRGGKVALLGTLLTDMEYGGYLQLKEQVVGKNVTIQFSGGKSFTAKCTDMSCSPGVFAAIKLDGCGTIYTDVDGPIKIYSA